MFTQLHGQQSLLALLCPPTSSELPSHLAHTSLGALTTLRQKQQFAILCPLQRGSLESRDFSFISVSSSPYTGPGTEQMSITSC